MSEPVLGVIPARLASSRLPRKLLTPLLGRTLIEWVWRRVSGMPLFQRLVIATDSDEILAICRSVGAPAILTDPDHPSGSDRVAEVVRLPEFREFPLVVNIQGDEPLVSEDHLRRTVALVRDEGWDVGTCATPVLHRADYLDPSVVKVVRARDGGALYFSRAPIPFSRDRDPDEAALEGEPFLRHVGVYAYRREALLRWVSLPPSTLEKIERLEQLRALEDGMAIGVALVDGAAPGVDTPADVATMERLLSQRNTHLLATERI